METSIDIEVPQPPTISSSPIENRPTQLPTKKPFWMRPPALGFMTLFAVVGCYFLIKSFAATIPIATIEAENMTLPAGAKIMNDTSASGSKSAAFTMSGAVFGTVNFQKPVNSINVVAKGDQCAGSPTINVAIDGITIMINNKITSNSWGNYSTNTPDVFASGAHTFTVTFSNDYVNTKIRSKESTCKRNFYIDVIQFSGPEIITPRSTI